MFVTVQIRLINNKAAKVTEIKEHNDLLTLKFHPRSILVESLHKEIGKRTVISLKACD